MAFSQTDFVAIRTDITVTKAGLMYNGLPLLVWWNLNDDPALANYYNTLSSPVVQCWREDVSTQLLIDEMDGAEYTTGTTAVDVAKRSMFDLITRPVTINAAKARVRSKFAQVAGVLTQATWTSIAQREATNIEALFAGAPVGGAVVTTKYGVRVLPDDIKAARVA